MTDWRSEAVCAKPKNVRQYFEQHDIWFHDEDDSPEIVERDNNIALSLCAACPVRDLCLKDALETQTIHGFRGGLSEDQTRQVLSQDETGKEVRRQEYPFCPFCKADTEHLITTTIDLGEGGRWSVAKAVKCGVCDFEWKSRASHNALLAYQRDEKKRMEAEEREAQAVKGLQRPS